MYMHILRNILRPNPFVQHGHFMELTLQNNMCTKIFHDVQYRVKVLQWLANFRMAWFRRCNRHGSYCQLLSHWITHVTLYMKQFAWYWFDYFIRMLCYDHGWVLFGDDIYQNSVGLIIIEPFWVCHLSGLIWFDYNWALFGMPFIRIHLVWL